MIVAVTGGTGLVGGFLVPALRARGHQVRLLTRPKPGRELAQVDGVTYVEGRLDEKGPIERLVHGADVILHAAYQHEEPSPVEGRSVSEHYVHTNYVGSMRLLERTAELGAKQMIYVSTTAVYGHDFDDDPLADLYRRDENFPLWPDAFYGAMRSGVETMCVAAAKAYGINVSVFRLGCVLGNRAVFDEITAAPMVKEAVDHGEIRTSCGAYILDASDAAEILVKAVGDDSLRARVFNTFDYWYDFADLAEPLSEILGREVKAVCPRSPGPRSPLLADAIHEWFDGWRTEARLRELLEVMVDRYRS